MFKLFGLLLLVHILAGAFTKSTWKYDIISVSGNSSNEDLLKLDLRAERVSRGVYALSGKIYFFVEMNNDLEIEVNAFRSATGTSAYKKIPYGVSRRTYEDFMNTLYKDVLMESFKSCSNAPQFTDKVGKIEKQIFELKRCAFSNENLPHMVDGYYKIIVAVYGKKLNLEAFLEIALKIEPSIM